MAILATSEGQNNNRVCASDVKDVHLQTLLPIKIQFSPYKKITIHWIQNRRSSHVAKELVSYLTGGKVKVVRIARRVKVKYVIKVILPAPAGLSRAGEGAPWRGQVRSGNYVSLGWEFVDCFYIWEIPGDQRKQRSRERCAKVGTQQLHPQSTGLLRCPRR